LSTPLVEQVVERFVSNWFNDPKTDTTAAGVLASMLGEVVVGAVDAIAGELGVDASHAIRSAFSIRPEISDSKAAEKVAQVLQHLLPTEARTIGALALMAPPTIPRVPAGIIRDLDRVLEDVAPEIREMLVGPAAEAEEAATMPPERWSISFLADRFAEWRATLDVWEDTCEHEAGLEAIAAMREQMDHEMYDVPRRYAIAEIIRDSAKQPAFRQSTRAIGNQVHDELQKRYLRSRWHNTVVSEWWVYWHAGRGPRRLTISEYSRRVLQESNGLDRTYAAVEQARLTPFRRAGLNKIRWDLLDMSLRQIWEIKSVASAPSAVVQETYYRLHYQRCAIPWLCFGSTETTQTIEPGNPDYPVHDRYSGDLLIDTMFARVLPFTTDLLPGLVLYLVLRRRNRSLERVLESVRAFRAAVEAAVSQLREILHATRILLFVIALIVLLVIVLIILLFMAIGAPKKPDRQRPGLPPPGGGDKVPVPDGRRRHRVPVGALRVSGGVGGLVLSLPPVDGAWNSSGDPATDSARIRMGRVLIDAVRAEDAGSIMADLADLFSDGLDAAARAAQAIGRPAADRPDA
jgi:hypothetical protein